MSEYKMFQFKNLSLLPGQKLCHRCKITLFKDKGQEPCIEDSDIKEELSAESAMDIVNKSLEVLECSPLKKSQV